MRKIDGKANATRGCVQTAGAVSRTGSEVTLFKKYFYTSISTKCQEHASSLSAIRSKRTVVCGPTLSFHHRPRLCGTPPSPWTTKHNGFVRTFGYANKLRQSSAARGGNTAVYGRQDTTPAQVGPQHACKLEKHASQSAKNTQNPDNRTLRTRPHLVETI